MMEMCNRQNIAKTLKRPKHTNTARKQKNKFKKYGAKQIHSGRTFGIERIHAFKCVIFVDCVLTLCVVFFAEHFFGSSTEHRDLFFCNGWTVDRNITQRLGKCEREEENNNKIDTACWYICVEPFLGLALISPLCVCVSLGFNIELAVSCHCTLPINVLYTLSTVFTHSTRTDLNWVKKQKKNIQTPHTQRHQVSKIYIWREKQGRQKINSAFFYHQQNSFAFCSCNAVSQSLCTPLVMVMLNIICVYVACVSMYRATNIILSGAYF